MADDMEEVNATYESLLELERDFEDVETEIIRQQYALSKPLFEKREKLAAKIPNFWPLVLEQAPPDIDQYIQPRDSALLLTSLKSLSVSHFEIENGGKGDPRSIAIRMEFAENEHFEDTVLEKKFWYRRSQDGYAGLVSEPVPINWKSGKDLTHGLLDLAVKVWEEDKKKKSQANGVSKEEEKSKKKKKVTKPEDWTADQKELRAKIDAYGLGGVSFFCWFGYRGEDISAEENAIAVEEDKKKRAETRAGKTSEEEDEEDEEEEDEDEEEDSLALEIFPDGDDLAVAFSEDLWPSAIKYFTQAQEADAMSDLDFEEEDEEMTEGEGGNEEEDDDDEAPPLKKVKA
ncbi:nucleosome assembly protein [Xylariaceae sp. FL0594]|nr:nucleosome assembly protein [Xylariaceae sp. FL0594]